MRKKQNSDEILPANDQKAEEDLLRKAISSSYTEPFHAMTRLMRLGMLLKSATIVHQKIN